MVSEATVDVAVRRVLRARFELGETPPLADDASRWAENVLTPMPNVVQAISTRGSW